MSLFTSVTRLPLLAFFAVACFTPLLRAHLNHANPYFFTTLAGSGAVGFLDGTGTAATFSNPTGIAVDAAGTVFVVDSLNSAVRKISRSGVVTKITGPGGAVVQAGFFAKGIALDTSGRRGFTWPASPQRHLVDLQQHPAGSAIR